MDVEVALLAKVADAAGAANGIGGNGRDVVKKFSAGQVHIGARIDGDGDIGHAIFGQDGTPKWTSGVSGPSF